MPAPAYKLTEIGQAWRTRVPEELYPSAYIADRTIDKLKEYASRDQPFFLQCSFPDPHQPFTPPGRFWDMYAPEDVELPASFHGNVAPPPHVRWLYEQRERGILSFSTTSSFACDEREAREAIALNYASITNIDTQIGKVVDALTALGLRENTVIVFTSDHGDYMGDHRLLLKGPIHYRGLIRTPFIWSDPALPDGACRSSALTSTVDIAPTILARAGVKPFNGVQGKNMLDLMSGAKSQLREHLLIEEEGQRITLGFDSRIRCRTLLSDGYRLTVYDGTDWGELYDLRKDPDELNNRWDDAGCAGTRHALMERLMRSMLEHTTESPFPTSLA